MQLIIPKEYLYFNLFGPYDIPIKRCYFATVSSTEGNFDYQFIVRNKDINKTIINLTYNDENLNVYFEYRFLVRILKENNFKFLKWRGCKTFFRDSMI